MRNKSEVLEALSDYASGYYANVFTRDTISRFLQARFGRQFRVVNSPKLPAPASINVENQEVRFNLARIFAMLVKSYDNWKDLYPSFESGVFVKEIWLLAVRFLANHEGNHQEYTMAFSEIWKIFLDKVAKHIPQSFISYTNNVVEDSKIDTLKFSQSQSLFEKDIIRVGIKLFRTVDSIEDMVAQLKDNNYTIRAHLLFLLDYRFCLMGLNKKDLDKDKAIALAQQDERFVLTNEVFKLFDSILAEADTKIRTTRTVTELVPMLWDLFLYKGKEEIKDAAAGNGSLLDAQKVLENQQQKQSSSGGQKQEQEEDEEESSSGSSQDSEDEDEEDEDDSDSGDEKQDGSSGESSNNEGDTDNEEDIDNVDDDEQGSGSSSDGEAEDEEDSDLDSEDDTEEGECESSGDSDYETEDEDLDDKESNDSDCDSSSNSSDSDGSEESSEESSEDSSEDSSDGDSSGDSEDNEDTSSSNDNDNSSDDGGSGASYSEEELEQMARELLEDVLEDVNEEAGDTEDTREDRTTEEQKQQLKKDISQLNKAVALSGVNTISLKMKQQTFNMLNKNVYFEYQKALKLAYNKMPVEKSGYQTGEFDENLIERLKFERDINVFARKTSFKNDKNIFVTFLIDISGSMSDKIGSIRSIVPELVHAFESVHIKTRIFTFSDDSYLVKDFNDKLINKNFHSNLKTTFCFIEDLAGTNPLDALNFLLCSSYDYNAMHQNENILIFITDGCVNSDVEDMCIVRFEQLKKLNYKIFPVGLELEDYDIDSLERLVGLKVFNYSGYDMYSKLGNDLKDFIVKNILK